MVTTDQMFFVGDKKSPDGMQNWINFVRKKSKSRHRKRQRQRKKQRHRQMQRQERTWDTLLNWFCHKKTTMSQWNRNKGNEKEEKTGKRERWRILRWIWRCLLHYIEPRPSVTRVAAGVDRIISDLVMCCSCTENIPPDPLQRVICPAILSRISLNPSLLCQRRE